MITVNSLSGGKTSSFIALNYKADINIFSLCCIDSHNAGNIIDHKIKKMVNDKLQKYSSHWPEFLATSEDPKILKLMFDLEQKLGDEIIWVRGMGWERMMDYKRMMPNISKRFCTSILKIQPIFEYLYMYTELPVKMRIGYRYDEMERANKFLSSYKMAFVCEYRPKSNTWINRWKEIPFRVADFCLIDDKIDHYSVHKYFKDNFPDLVFPNDSNCLNCFWKSPQQLRKNRDTCMPIMMWSAIQEEIRGHQFKKEISILDAVNLPLQLDFFYGGGSGCQAGYCTD